MLVVSSDHDHFLAIRVPIMIKVVIGLNSLPVIATLAMIMIGALIAFLPYHRKS